MAKSSEAAVTYPIILLYIIRMFGLIPHSINSPISSDERWGKIIFWNRKHRSHSYISHDMTKCVFGSFRPSQTQPACTATEVSYSLEISAKESRDIILSKQQRTKVLIRLRGCAGWSAPLLFAYDIRHIFSWPCSYALLKIPLWYRIRILYLLKLHVHRVNYILNNLMNYFPLYIHIYIHIFQNHY